MPDIEVTNTDRISRVSQSTKAGRGNYRSSVPSINELDEGIPQYALSKDRGQVYQFIKINGQMYHSVLEKGQISELDIEIS
tara:strand:+ start:1782 stop:2024 length:243 start_codon:yes stop_codon:yes gene_type:complete